LSQGLGNLFGGLQGQYMQGLLGQDIAGMQQPGYQPQHPLAQQMMLQMQDPMYQARLQAEKARTTYWSRPTSGGTIDQRLRAAESLLSQARIETDLERRNALRQRAKEVTEGALELMNPNDTSPAGNKLKRRVEKVAGELNRTITPTQPTAKPIQDETDVIAEHMKQPSVTPKATQQGGSFRGTGATGSWDEFVGPPESRQRNIFAKYPPPKTEREFERTLSHIPTIEKKRLYFENMMGRIEDDALVGKLYTKWGNILYR